VVKLDVSQHTLMFFQLIWNSCYLTYKHIEYDSSPKT